MTNIRDRDQRTPAPGDDEVAALFRLAGTPPALPESEVRPIRAAAREVWRRQLHRRATRRRPAWVAAALAAGLLIVVALDWLTGERAAPPPPSAPVAALEVQAGEVAILPAGRVSPGSSALLAGSVLSTGRDGHVALKLSAGSSLRLDSESRVRLESAQSFGLERGALYVDSQHLPGQVEILTPLGRVTDFGTQFEVRLSAARDAREAQLRVRVREGEVRIDTESDTHRAIAGSELVLAADGSTRRGAVTAADAGWQWAIRAAPAPVIEGRTLESFLDWASRELGLPWRLVEPRPERSPRATVLHGSVDGLTPEEALGVVLTGSGLRYESAEGELRISSAEADGER